MSSLLWIPVKDGIGVKGGPKTRWRQGYFTDNFNVWMKFEIFLSKWEVIDPIKVWSFNSMP
jgi:hypothetical protein